VTQVGRYGGEFDAVMCRYAGVGGWHFVSVPDDLSPRATHAWGRTPVVATVDGHTWRTSVWRGKGGQTALAIPKRVRNGKGDGDVVHVEVRFDSL